MPQGKGTYGSKRGRPPKKKKGKKKKTPSMMFGVDAMQRYITDWNKQFEK